MKDKLRSEIKDWKKKYEVEQSECKFFHKSALEQKRKNKLLKMSVKRLEKEYTILRHKFKSTDDELKLVNSLQEQIDAVKRAAMGEEEDDSDIFMTKITNDAKKQEMKLPELSNSRGMQGLDMSGLSEVKSV